MVTIKLVCELTFLQRKCLQIAFKVGPPPSGFQSGFTFQWVLKWILLLVAFKEVLLASGFQVDSQGHVFHLSSR